MWTIFWYQTLVAIPGILGRKFPVVECFLSSHEQEVYPTTSLGENCVEFEFRTDRNYYNDSRQMYLALKLHFDVGRGYEI